jgi:1-acyl-sn-glycerol-3-phosphate acyltransferase
VKATSALRSALSVLALLAFMVLGGLYQRLVVYPVVYLRPRWRSRVTSRYFRGMSHGILFCMRMGGATLRRSGTVPTASPVLVLMNHQSLLDIPTVGLMSWPLVPWFVTRNRYHYGVPAVSPCLRLMGCPVIDPNDPRGSLRTMKKAARALEHGMLIFAEGHRTLDGEIQPFQTAGVLTVLRERRLPVYVVVTDGFWSARRLVDFVLGVANIKGETEVLGLFEPPADADALPAFVESLHEAMVAHLALMRGRRGDNVSGLRDGAAESGHSPPF